jgi:hypothetical protein
MGATDQLALGGPRLSSENSTSPARPARGQRLPGTGPGRYWAAGFENSAWSTGTLCWTWVTVTEKFCTDDVDFRR